MRILTIGLDRKLFEKNSAVRARAIEYGSLFEELHIIVLSLKRHSCKSEQIASNVWIYPTHSLTRLHYLYDVFRLVTDVWVREEKLLVDVISAQGPECGLIGWLIGRKYKRPVQLQLHGDTWSPYFNQAQRFNGLRKLLTQFLLKRVSCVRVVSKREADETKKRYPRLEGKVSLLPIYVDVEHFKEAIPAFDLHEKYPQFSTRILMVGRLTAEKNIAFALTVFKEVLKQYPRTGLIIAGDGPLQNKLKKRARMLGIENNVIFLGWQSDVVSLYKTADLFLHTSRYEGYGMALIEAAACNLPIVSSYVGVASSLKEIEGISVCSVDDMHCFVTEINARLTGTTKRVSPRTSLLEVTGIGLESSKEAYLEAYKKSMEQCIGNIRI